MAGVSFDTDTIELMRAVLEETVTKLPTHLRSVCSKVELAAFILKAAAGGEGDPRRLGSLALIGVMARHRPSPGKEEAAQNRIA
jgi:hypothetical protein